MFKEDYKAQLAEYEKFWERKNKKRPILNMTYRLGSSAPYRAPTSLEEKWLDVDYKYAFHKHRVANTGYIAEGIPMRFTNYGPGCLSACIGGSFELSRDTIWFDRVQLIKDWELAPSIGFDEQSPIWQNVIKEQARYAADPDVHFSITDIGGILDVVASLRGTENLLYDLYDYPDEVKEFSTRVRTEWDKAFAAELSIVEAAAQPYNNWMNIPSSKPWYPIQCDFCYMISPTQFEEFVLPDVSYQARSMPRSIYHLDGEGEIRHLDMLLDIPELTGIQWTAGDGNAPLYDEKWFGLYRRIQDKKKNLVLLGAIGEHDMAGAERLIKSIDPVGVHLSLGASSRERALDMIEKIERWCE